MATHVVCPLCGKSSSLKSFPSGSGTDLALQSFRGKGRGRGFEAIPGGSGLGDERLARAVHDKLMTILQTFESRGFPSAPPSPTRNANDNPQLRERILAAERELAHEKTAREFVESEVEGLESDLARERASRDRALARVALLSHQLDIARRTQDQLIASSRDTIMSLRQLRAQLQGVPFAAESLAPVVRDIKQMVDLVQELRAVSIVKSAISRDAPSTR